MIKLNPEIYLRKMLFDQLYQSVHGELAEQLAKMCLGTSSLMAMTNSCRSYQMPIEKDTLSDLYSICQRVQKTLGFKEKINYFLVSSSDINAGSCYSRDTQETPHVVTLDSGLVNIMSEAELAFVIGHEIGHLINKDSLVENLVRFAAIKDDDEDEENMPRYLKVRLDMYRLLSELEADRYGYLACENEEVAIMTMFKLGAGMDISRLGVSFENLLKSNKKYFNRYWKDDLPPGEGHPVNPIRVEALHIFANAENEKQLEKRMEKIEDKLRNLRPIEAVDFRLYAALGLKLAQVDGGMSDMCYRDFICKLGGIVWYPEEFLSILMKRDVDELLDETIQIALKEGLRSEREILALMADIAYLDGVFTPAEIDAIIALAEKLGLPESVYAEVLAETFRDGFIPIIPTNR